MCSIQARSVSILLICGTLLTLGGAYNEGGGSECRFGVAVTAFGASTKLLDVGTGEGRTHYTTREHGPS